MSGGGMASTDPPMSDAADATTRNRILTQAPVAQVGMLIRRPVSEVFEAFVDPAITSRFWFTDGSGRLEPGARVTWTWAMYDVSAAVDVKAIEPRRRIFVEWSNGGASSTIEWLFADRVDGTTFVTITNAGYSGNADERVNQAVGSAEAFALVLAGLKALLEHDIDLRLVPDRFPADVDAE
jgi:uncharacterized protein YndB with AHSA1/START domain